MILKCVEKLAMNRGEKFRGFSAPSFQDGTNYGNTFSHQ